MVNTKKNSKKKLKLLIKKLSNLKKNIKFQNNKHFQALLWLHKKRQLNMKIKNQENLQQEIKKALADSDRYKIATLLINKSSNQISN